MLKTALLFIITALAEILGCWLFYAWLRLEKSIWLLIPSLFSLVLFAYLLTLHPQASGRIYASYGGIYIAISLLWLRYVDSIPLQTSDWLGALICLSGASVIIMGSSQS
ncbi:YnfA family protein [Pelistega ratti]|uniref:YnfA family protein n=1 Tax=Pelistega ratti TaxID=2652177 RepID=UPI00135C18E2|nr:YnfA family protein [Pelistega ratti]